MTSPRAVLWDMDGTLIDSEPYWIAAETALVESYGGTWSAEQGYELIGNALPVSARLLQAAGVKMEIPEIVDHLTAAVMDRIVTSGVPFRPGARELLFDLRQAGIPTAMVTMSMRRLAKTVIERIDFPAFDLLIGGDDVERPKPDPHPYLTAAKSLGVDIADAIAIEDSTAGVTSAVASGAVTIGATNIVDISGLGADVVWNGLDGRTVGDLTELFRQVRTS
ncbi:HAD family hydrolase [Microbacterium halotolerans]|uniref:HAD family hydrolase n=1 Tax=Microbacterium halotolerans TaxID=246613 RepID=UPI000E6AA49B|nr:HAD family phosphatase [Microbacterium halotolerans]